MLKVGLIGMGMIGQRYIEVITKSGVTLAGVTGSSGRSSNIYAELYDTRPYETWQQMVHSGKIDVIVDNTPNHLHHEINSLCLENKIPVYSEKPLGRTTAETRNMVELANKAGIPNAVNYNRRGFPAIQRMRSIILNGEIGDVMLVRGHYLQDWLLRPESWNWRVDPKSGEITRALSDIGTHLIDLAFYLTQLEPESIFYERKTLIPKRKNPQSEWIDIQNEDYGTLLIRFKSGAQGVFTFCQTAAGHIGSDMEIEISGTKAGLFWREQSDNQITVKRYMDSDDIIEVETSKYNSHGQFEVFSEFIEWIQGKKREHVATFADGHQLVYLAELAQKSFESGQWQKWSLS